MLANGGWPYMKARLRSSDLVVVSLVASESPLTEANINSPETVAGSAPHRSRRGGRKEKWPWQDFYQECFLAVYQGKFITYANIKDHMTAWCATTWN